MWKRSSLQLEISSGINQLHIRPSGYKRSMASSVFLLTLSLKFAVSVSNLKESLEAGTASTVRFYDVLQMLPHFSSYYHAVLWRIPKILPRALWWELWSSNFFSRAQYNFNFIYLFCYKWKANLCKRRLYYEVVSVCRAFPPNTATFQASEDFDLIFAKSI